MTEDVIADCEVDDGRQEDAYPDGNVGGVDAKCVPVVANPAPKLQSRQKPEEVMTSSPDVPWHFHISLDRLVEPGVARWPG